MGAAGRRRPRRRSEAAGEGAAAATDAVAPVSGDDVRGVDAVPSAPARGRRAESVEDALNDWPEGGARDDDAWLLERGDPADDKL